MKCKQNTINLNQLAREDFWRILNQIRSQNKFQPESTLDDQKILKFLAEDQNLQMAVYQAGMRFSEITKEFPEAVNLSTADLIQELHQDILNFYSADGIPPFVPLTAMGPWIVTFHGGVIYDVGAYGMLGYGHNPAFLKQSLCEEQVMANVKTVCFSQRRTCQTLKQNIRQGKCPYDKFMFVNSGTEAVAVATRISDANALVMTQAGGKHQGKKIKFLTLAGSFHGRTQREALASDSTWQTYQVLASFKDNHCLVTVEPNNIDELRAAFEQAEKDGVFFEAMLIEPVMGEGRAGFAITPEFYNEARRLTSQHGGMLVVDSIQAGLRCHGYLSILDYPGFQDSAAPDLETYSKAVNAGQYPLSVVALSSRAISAYKKGTYGNTMTTNPRALDIANTILTYHTSEVTQNIKDQGAYALQKLQALKEKFPKEVKEILGTGLLFSLQLIDQIPIEGLNGIERQIRLQGVNVIHSSGNRLRFTPWFKITPAEVDLLFEVVEDCLVNAQSLADL